MHPVEFDRKSDVLCMAGRLASHIRLLLKPIHLMSPSELLSVSTRGMEDREELREKARTEVENTARL